MSTAQSTIKQELDSLLQKAQSANLPEPLLEKINTQLTRLSHMSGLGFFPHELDSLSRYIDWVIKIPWQKETEAEIDLKKTKKILDENHYGLEKVKQRVLEELAVMKLIKEKKSQGSLGSQTICFVGLPGIGKTSIASSISEALGRPFCRIAMGGFGEANQLRGQSRFEAGSEPGLIIKQLIRAGVKNPVFLLDEIDRTAETGRAAIMGVLLELLDPEQNFAFHDYYLDFPFDLSEVLFLASCNNTRGIANAVLDRLEIIEMPAYSDREKLNIARDYLLPKALKACGLSPDQLVINEGLWPKIIRPLGFDAGIRSLDRTLNTICRRVARKVVEEGNQQFVLAESNIKEFLPT